LAEADLDVVIRYLVKQPNKSLMEAAKKRHDRFMAMATAAKDKESKQRYKQIAKNTLLHAGAAARRLQLSAQNAADSYARAMKKAAEQPPVRKPAVKKPVKKKMP
jgi:predicted nucleic acid-binding protein